MSNQVCLDTSAYSHSKRGNAGLTAELSAAQKVYFPTVVIGELGSSFLLGTRQSENEKELRKFLSNPYVHVLDIDQDVATRYLGYCSYTSTP